MTECKVKGLKWKLWNLEGKFYILAYFLFKLRKK